MITINLKPGSKRAAAGASLAGGMSALRSMRTRVKDPWPMAALVVVALTAIGLAWIGFGSASKVSSLEDELATARAENRRFKSFLIEKKRAEAARDSVILQIATIRSVDGDRYVWPHILDEVTRSVPPFTWLTEMTATAQPFQLLGRTMDIQGFTRFMRQLEDSPWLRDVTVVSTTTEIDHGRAVTAFTVRAAYDRPGRGRAPVAPAGER